MNIPQDPVMLMSMINMKMRDGDYTGLDDLCASLGIDKDDLISRLKGAGLDWMPAIKQFR